MSRPLKDGVDYFPFDVDFFQDEKIRLIRAEFGAKGILILISAFCDIYREGGYFKKWDDNDSCVLMAEAVGCGCSKNLVSEVIHKCLKRSIFNDRVFQMFSVLTSAAIQRRYIRAVCTRDHIAIKKEFWLLDETSEKDVPSRVRAKLTLFSENEQKTESKSAKNPVSFESYPQSKVKESKVKKSKEDHPRACEEDDDLKRVCKAYEDSIGLMPRHVAASAMSFIQAGMETALVIRAIQLAAENNARTWSYVSAILRNCENKGIKTLGAFEADRRNRKDEHNTSACAGGSNEGLSLGVHF